MTRLIDNMERQHLVVRISDKKDRRTNLIHLTKDGKELEERARVIANQTLNRGDSHYKVGDIKCKGDKIGFEMCQFTGYAEVWNQYGIDPRHKSEDKEHPCQNCN